ncbi:unnamed protein product, partial [Durusdinium trenchii]
HFAPMGSPSERGMGRASYPTATFSTAQDAAEQVVLRLVAESALKRKDLDKDGELSLQEFWEGDVTAGGPDGHQEEEATFKLLDKDGSGRLSVVELMDWESGVHHTQVAFKVT